MIGTHHIWLISTMAVTDISSSTSGRTITAYENFNAFSQSSSQPSSTGDIGITYTNTSETTDVFRHYFSHYDSIGNDRVAIYVLSAFIRENLNENITETNGDTSNGFSHAVHLTAWEHGHHYKEMLKCCYFWTDGRSSEMTDPTRRYPAKMKSDNFRAVHYTCYLNKPDKLHGSFIIPKHIKCAQFQPRVIKPQLSFKAENGSIGVCLKILYDRFDTKLLVDWMEYYKEMKVDKVVTKTFNISEDAQKVLNNYVEEGFVEVVPFDYPWRHDGMKRPESLIDEMVAMLDCQERLRRYTYMTIIDLDEFFFPYQNDNMKDMMANLTNVYPNTTGFLLKSEMFIKEWGESESTSGSDIVRYFKRFAPKRVRPKYIAITSAIADGRLRTHFFNRGTDFTPFKLSENVAAIKHYRNQCCVNQVCNGTRYNDTSILTVVQRFKDRSSRVLRRLEIQ